MTKTIRLSDELFEGVKVNKLITKDLVKFLVETQGATLENPNAERPLQEIKIDGKEYLIAKEEDILAIID